MLNGVQNINNVRLSSLKAKSPLKKVNTSSPFARTEFYSNEASQALKLNSLNFARTIKFAGALNGAFAELNQSMVTCKTKDKNGENVGSRVSVNRLLHDFQDEFAFPDDAVKTTVKVGSKKIEDANEPIYARTQIKLISQDEEKDKRNLLFEMAVRPPKVHSQITDRSEGLNQLIDIAITPINYRGEGTKEQTYILNTKGNLMAVVEDNDNVLLTNAGRITKRTSGDSSMLDVVAHQYIKDNNGSMKENAFKPFELKPVESVKLASGDSIGQGGKIVIAMEQGRFTDELKDSIVTFKQKIANGEVELPQFIAAENADKTLHIMLAGGFGSRAEYTNASSSAIFHDVEGGAQSTKGVFRTPTGLTPMETTLLSLHLAGQVDLSKIELTGPNANVIFYENQSGRNKGNGGFSLDAIKKLKESNLGFDSVVFYANDAMSRTKNAILDTQKLMDSGNAAIALIAKKVKAQDCIKTFGIMRIDENNQILEFAEKPTVIDEGYKIREVNPNTQQTEELCLTNAFQFGVSMKAFDVLELVEPFFSTSDKSKETRDWSKQYVPIIKTISSETDYDKIRQELKPVFGPGATPLPDYIITQAKNILGNQKVYAVPTDEPWADCGSLNALYHTIMQIADQKEFKLEPFEVRNLIACINNKTGLVASSPQQKKEIEEKYDIDGEVMVVKQAKKVDTARIADIPVIINPRV